MERTNVDNLVKANWKVDKVHTKMGFTARHMAIAEVEGQLREFNIKVDSGDDFTPVKLKLQ